MSIDDKNIAPQVIADYIVSKNILEKKTITEAMDAFINKKLEAGFAFYSLENYGQNIELKDETGATQKSLTLPVKADKNIKWIPYSSNSVLVLDENDNEFKNVINREEQKGLALSNKGGFLKLNEASYLLNQWYFELVSEKHTENLPLDLYIPDKQTNFIFMTDRGSGKLYVLPTNLKKVTQEIKVRQVDTRKAINIAYSGKAKKCFITDNQTPDLVTLNPDTNKVERFYQDYGSLGNLVLSKDEKHLYIISCEYDKPASLLLVSTNGFKLVKTIHLEGTLFSEADDPTDLIAISPNGKFVYVMTYVNQPSLLTPIISVISTENNEVTSQLELASDDKPVGISFKIDLPLSEEKPSFSQLLVDKKLMHESNMQIILNELGDNKDKKKEYSASGQLLDPDINDLQSEIELNLAGREKELAELLEATEEDINRLLQETGVDWQGRRMTKEDKESLIRKLATISSNPEISKTNGVFVLNWMNDLLK